MCVIEIAVLIGAAAVFVGVLAWAAWDTFVLGNGGL